MHTVRSTVQVLVLVLLIALLVLLLVLVPLEQIEYWGIDIGYYRAAARALRYGADPFAHENLYQYADGAHIDKVLGYTYTPVFVLFLWPLTWLSHALASRVWLLVNLGMLAGSIYLIAQALAWNLTAKRFLSILLGTVLFVPVTHALVPGQASVFVLFWLAASFYLLKRQRAFWAGVCLGLCFTKLQVLALVPLILLVRKKWRVLAGFALTLFLSTVPFWQLWPSWLEAIQRTTQINMEHSGYLNQPCLSAVVKLLVSDSLVCILLTGIGTAGLVAMVIWLGVRSSSNVTGSTFDRTIAVVVTSSLLVAGYVRTHDLVLLLFPLAIMLDQSGVMQVGPIKGSTLAWGVAAFALPYVMLLLTLLAPVFKASIWHQYHLRLGRPLGPLSSPAHHLCTT